MATKKLASELGLLRKRPLLQMSQQRSSKRQKTDQIFTHLIVLDFESTCWETDRTIPQEIIEFPAVLMNTQTGMIESEFHYFLQPSEKPVLSEFCQQLTGITQNQVDNGIPLSLCLRKFAAWLRKLHVDKGLVCSGDSFTQVTKSGIKATRPDTSKGGTTALVTWSDWDLGVCLLYESRRKQISRPPSLTEWIDLRATYKEFYGRKPAGLNGALSELGIMFDGRQHSGLDDARNTARLAWQMIRDGCVMSVTKTVRTSLTGRVEHQSLPPSGPTYASLQSDTSPSDNSHIAPQMTVYTRAPIPFVIAHDTEQSRNISCRVVDVSPLANQHPTMRTDPQTRIRLSDQDVSMKTDAPARKGLSERNANLMLATDKSAGKQFIASRPKADTEVCMPSIRSNTISGHMIARNKTQMLTIANKKKNSCNTIAVLEESFNPAEQGTCQYTLLSNCVSPSTHVEILADSLPVRPFRCEAKHGVRKAQLPSAASAIVHGQPVSLNTSTAYYQNFTSLKAPSATLKTLTGTLKISTTTLMTPVTNLNTPCNTVKTTTSETPSPKCKTPTILMMPLATFKTHNTFTTTTTIMTPNTFKTPNTLKAPASIFKTTSVAIPNTSVVTPNTSFKTNTSLTTPNTSLTTPNTSLMTPNASFKTTNTSFKTTAGVSISAHMNITPPLCSCGRRSKSRVVQKQGPNTGRWFFSCSLTKDRHSGCTFFQWTSPSAPAQVFGSATLTSSLEHGMCDSVRTSA